MRKRTTFCLSFIAAGVLAATPQSETREHYIIAVGDHTPLYYATTITSDSETLGSETYLIESAAGQRIVIDVREDYRSHLVTADYSVNDANSVRVTLQLPGKGTTRSEWSSELHQHPELLNEDVPVTVEANGKALKTGEKEWKTSASSVRDQAKSIAGADLAAALAPLSSFLGFPPFGGACTTYQFVANGVDCGFSRSVIYATVRPDCDFDAKFGKPCDSEQMGRAKGQPKNKRVGPY